MLEVLNSRCYTRLRLLPNNQGNTNIHYTPVKLLTLPPCRYVEEGEREHDNEQRSHGTHEVADDAQRVFCTAARKGVALLVTMQCSGGVHKGLA